MKKAALVLALLLSLPAARADERAELEALRGTTLNLIRLLVTEGVLTQDKANALIKQAEAEAAAPGERKPPTVRVPYVPEVVRQQIKEQIREEVIQQARTERWAAPNSFPGWASGLTLYGDLRGRYQLDNFDPNNTPAADLRNPLIVGNPFPASFVNSQDDRDYFRLRGRLGLRLRAGETVEAGLGLATGTAGSTGNPNSTNQTLGDSFTRKTIGVDLAYVQWEPRTWFSAVGGKFRNPFFATELMFAPDLTFDGGAMSFRPRLREDFGLFGTVGAFPLESFEPNRAAQPTRKNKWLFGWQAGAQWTAPNDSSARIGAAFYDYRDIQGINDPTGANLFDWTAPQFRQRGNSMAAVNLAGTLGLASAFRVLNLTGELELAKWDPVRVTLLAEYARNVGFDADDITRRLGITAPARRTTAWLARLNIGHKKIERWGDWFVFAAYKNVQRDAVLDAFVEGDFNLGGTNAKGWIAGGGWGVEKNAWLGLKYTSANAIDGPPLAIDTFQLDFNVRF